MSNPYRNVTLDGTTVTVDDRDIVHVASIDYSELLRLEAGGFLTRREGAEWNFGHDVWFVA
mgnify:CR=1 FL=1